MGRLLNKLARKLGYVPAGSRRSYAFAHTDRLLNDWVTTGSSPDKEIRSDIKTMRERSRVLERDNDYVRRYLKLLENNVLGSSGIGLQMKIRERIQTKGKWIEQYDRRANMAIENAWARWGRKEFCTIQNGLAWRDLCGLVLRSTARDGAVLVRKHYTGDFGFSLEPIEIDCLDIDVNEPNYRSGGETRMGIDYDANGRVSGYHIFNRHPGALNGTLTPDRSQVIPASQVIHVFHPERVGQGTGVPWLHSSGAKLKHMDAFTEAAIVAARAGACKGGWLQRNGSEGYTGAGTDGDGNKVMEMSPGMWEELPAGLTPIPFDPAYPNTAFGDFIKASLRGIAAGLGVSYVSLANDLESVNYSSIRAGLLDEREEWKSIQNWFIDWFISPVFEEWLRVALAFGQVSEGNLVLPVAKFDKFNSPEWKPRRWDWVDPLKDLQASVLAVEKGFRSRRSIIGETGGDIEDTFADIAADEALAEENGLDFSESTETANDQQDTPDKPDDVDKAKEVKK